MEADELIRQLKNELAIPDVSEPSDSTAAFRDSADWRELERCVRELRSAADAVGVKPVGYPLPVDLTMRIVGALLPWYTRPLRAQAESCVALAAAVETVLGRMAHRQEDLEQRLRRLEEANGKDA